MNPMIQSWLLQSFVVFLIIGSIAGLVVGVLLLLFPQSLRRFGQNLNRWISTRHLNQPLERSVDVDPWFYRYRRVSGALILSGACYVFYYFSVSMDKANTVSALTKNFKLHPQLAGGLLDALVVSALLGALLTVFVGLFLLLRPSLLRNFEQPANRWVSMRRALKPLETANHNLDDYVFRYERQAGVLLVLGSLYVLVLMLSWIGR